MSVRETRLPPKPWGNPTRWKLAAFVFGAATAAIGGSLHAAYIQTIAPVISTSWPPSPSIIVSSGVGSITGTFVAAIVLGALDTILQNFGTLHDLFIS